MLGTKLTKLKLKIYDFVITYQVDFVLSNGEFTFASDD